MYPAMLIVFILVLNWLIQFNNLTIWTHLLYFLGDEIKTQDSVLLENFQVKSDIQELFASSFLYLLPGDRIVHV